jgi:uncharacterized membrane protein YuzA (DUF378 family)
MSSSNRSGTNFATQIVQWLSVIGALNWGLVGILDWDLVRAILGNDPTTPASAASRVIYALVGVSGVGLALLAPRMRRATTAAGLAHADA